MHWPSTWHFDISTTWNWLLLNTTKILYTSTMEIISKICCTFSLIIYRTCSRVSKQLREIYTLYAGDKGILPQYMYMGNWRWRNWSSLFCHNVLLVCQCSVLYPNKKQVYNTLWSLFILNPTNSDRSHASYKEYILREGQTRTPIHNSGGGMWLGGVGIHVESM